MDDGQRDISNRLRGLPAVGLVLASEPARALIDVHGKAAVTRVVKARLDAARAAILAGADVGVDVSGAALAADLAAPESTLIPAVNATGVLVHTNLGRAPLARHALDAAVSIARGYSTLEYDLEEGARGNRHGHAAALLCELTGAEDAVVVNNCAAAVMLTLAALARGREVVVSRGELVEIGGGFRVPDVMRESGASLVEVGTTNRTHPRDYVNACTEHTGLILKVHRSNFDIVGFTAEVDVAELSAVAKGAGVPLVLDAGSGALVPLPGCAHERPVAEALSDGADLVLFSGDKLLGGPQAGLIVGRKDLVESVRRHPLMRAMRPDKLCLAALIATLTLWRDRPHEVPLFRALSRSVDDLEDEARALCDLLQSRAPEGAHLEVVTTTSRVGGGASPRNVLESRAVAIGGLSAQRLCARLRMHAPPIIARIEDDLTLLDVRTLLPGELEAVKDGLLAAFADLAGEAP